MRLKMYDPDEIVDIGTILHLDTSPYSVTVFYDAEQFNLAVEDIEEHIKKVLIYIDDTSSDDITKTSELLKELTDKFTRDDVAYILKIEENISPIINREHILGYALKLGFLYKKLGDDYFYVWNNNMGSYIVNEKDLRES